MAVKPGFLTYIRKAFTYHWNILLFGAGLAGSVISGRPDIALPLIAAAELVYLGGLATHPKFQSYVQASAHSDAKAQVDETALMRLFNTLDPRSRARFEELRLRCRNLYSMATGLRQGIVEAEGMESFQMEGMNKLLWVFLKLLFTKNSLEQFLSRTDEKGIRKKISELETQIAMLGPVEEDTPTESKKRRTLQDTLTSANLRLENLIKARENHEFVMLELDRIDSKITSLAELSINRQDPEFISTEVDSVTSTMSQTEKVMSDLQFLSGLGEAEVVPPSFMENKVESRRT